MKQYFFLALLMILISISGCTNTVNQNKPQSSEQVQIPATEDHDIASAEATSESSASVTGEQPAEETPTLNSSNSFEPATASSEEASAVMRTSDIDFSNPGVYEITCNTIYTIDVNGDDILENISIINTTHDNEVYINGKLVTVTETDMYLTVNDSKADNIAMTYLHDAYIIKKELGDVGVILYGDAGSDDYVTYIYDVDGTGAILKDSKGFAFSSLTMNTVTLSGTLYIFGNWNASNDCIINEDFSLTYDNAGLYKLNGCITGDFLDTKIEITAQMLDGKVYVETKIPAGSRIYPKYGTMDYANDKGSMIFETENGSMCKLVFDYTDGWIYVDGINEFDVFENIVYVGY
jgi:hypothetical protein